MSLRCTCCCHKMRAGPAPCRHVHRAFLAAGDRMRLARSAGKPLLVEEFAAARDYLADTATGRGTVMAR